MIVWGESTIIDYYAPFDQGLTTMLDHAYRLSSSWLYFSEECKRLKSLFSRLDFPHHLTNSAINTFIYSRVADQQPLQASNRLAGNNVTRVVMPFKDQDSANIVKTQLKDLSMSSKPRSSPYLSVGKLAKTLKNVRPNRSWLIHSA